MVRREKCDLNGKVFHIIAIHLSLTFFSGLGEVNGMEGSILKSLCKKKDMLIQSCLMRGDKGGRRRPKGGHL